MGKVINIFQGISAHAGPSRAFMPEGQAVKFLKRVRPNKHEKLMHLKNFRNQRGAGGRKLPYWTFFSFLLKFGFEDSFIIL